MSLIDRIHNTFIDNVHESLSYKTIVLNFISATGLVIAIQGATEFFKLVGAICLAVSALINLIINRKRYAKGLKDSFSGCPDEDIKK